MNQRTLVKVSAREYCIGFRTISQLRKPAHQFLIPRTTLEELESRPEITGHDGHSFAILRHDIPNGTLNIDFSWLDWYGNDQLRGWEERVTLPYDTLMDFMRNSVQEGAPQEWHVLSMQTVRTPKFTFHDKAGLHTCLENRTVRKKLARALRDNFRDLDCVVFYHDFEKYSFFFQSYWGEKMCTCGGLILHGQDNLKTASYSVHT